MKADKLKQIKAHANAIAELLYEETDCEQVKTLEGIEQTVRQLLAARPRRLGRSGCEASPFVPFHSSTF